MIAEIYEDHVVLWQKGKTKYTAWLWGKVSYVTMRLSGDEWGIVISDYANSELSSIVFVTAIRKGGY